MSHPSYHDFARIYDSFMQDAPYEQWMSWFSREELAGKVIADIGCGTGTLAIWLAQRTARVTGVDLSEEMLTAASQRAVEQRLSIEWLCQDMRELALPRKMNMIVSTCDSLNYLLSEEELKAVFSACKRALEPRGRFVFDLLGPARVEQLREGVWYDLRDDAELWFTSGVSVDGRIDYEVHGFFEDDGNGLYRRIVEEHTEQYYSVDTVVQLLQETGFVVEDVTGDFHASSPAQADRLVFHVQNP